MKRIITAIAAVMLLFCTGVSAEDLSGYVSKQGENGKYAFFGANGERLTDYVYDEVTEEFSNERTWLFNDTFVASHGDMKTERRVYTSHASCEYAVVVKDGRVMYIDTDFNEIEIYDRDDPFYTDLAPKVSYGYEQMSVGLADGHPYSKKHTGVYDTNTNRAVWIDGDYGAQSVYAISKNYLLLNMPDGKTGVIDSNGRLVLEPIYDNAEAAIGKDWRAIEDTVIIGTGEGEESIYLPDYVPEQKTVYNTAVKVKINNAQIPCYLIDDYAVIAAEDLGGYGYDVVWDADKRRLCITRNPKYYEINPEYEPKGENSTVYTYTENSDIQVLFNNRAVQAYSIGGRMLIRPESAMTGDDVKCVFDWDTYTLNITIDGLEMK